MTQDSVVVFWFRRDLRLDNNTGLSRALTVGFPVLPVFIFDPDILDKLDNKADRRVDYIQQALTRINEELHEFHSRLHTFYGKPHEIFSSLCLQFDIRAVFTNRDYEPQAIARDTEIYSYCKGKGIPFIASKDQVIFDRNELLKPDQTPYTVYTPYAKKWRQLLKPENYKEQKTEHSNWYTGDFKPVLTLEQIGFKKTDIAFKKPELDATIIDSYDQYRDYPSLQWTTQLGIALRFGTISIRQCVHFGLRHSQTWLSELIWREFFMQILYHFPRVVDHPFQRKYEFIAWRNDERDFVKWCAGKTGYPLVDAGMRQLKATGYMHNRVRMVTASFLCKHLSIDWRWGEAYFAEQLNDYDLASNNGNWQWAAGCGCDAAPYFRIFNPQTQMEKFDPKQEYVSQWIPELHTSDYPLPIVEHRFARERALKVYAAAIKDLS